MLLAHLPEGEPVYPDDYLTDQPERFFVAELVREQVLEQTHDELPFSTAVVVDEASTRRAAKESLRLYCSIVVERETQKRILVGKGGRASRPSARRRASNWRNSSTPRVFLDLHVKVREGWREDDRVLDSIGLLSSTAALRLPCVKFRRLSMGPHRRSDLVLDSVKRLLRIGATANLLNLLQKQHPADLAQILGAMLESERLAVFSVLVERNSRLAMEAVSEMGRRSRSKPFDRPFGGRHRPASAGDSDRRCRQADRLPAR